MQARSTSSGIGIDADDFEILVGAPDRELLVQARADADDDIDLRPHRMAERQGDAERVAAVEHAAAAAITGDGGLQHRRQFGHFGRGILRTAAADDHRVLGGAEQLGGRYHGVLVDRWLENGEGAISATGSTRPQTSMPTSRAAGPGRSVNIGLDRISHHPRRVRRAGDSGGMVNQPGDDAGLIADFVEVA